MTVDEVFVSDKHEDLWLNAFMCIRPTDEFLRNVGRVVIDKLNKANGYPKEVILRVHSS